MTIPDVFLGAYQARFNSRGADFSAITQKTGVITAGAEKAIHDVKEERGTMGSASPISEKGKDNFLCSEAGYEKMKSDVADLYLKNDLQQQELEKKYKKNEDDSFWSNTGNQWMVISKDLYDKGFYDNMSDEEVKEVETILAKITAGMDGLSRMQYDTGMDFSSYFCESGCAPEMSTNEAILELESSTAALKVFGEKYIAPEDREEFNKLVDNFHEHNASIIEDYRPLSEGINKAIHNIHAGKYGYTAVHRAYVMGMQKESDDIDSLIYLGGINHTKEDKELYQKKLLELFTKLQSEDTAKEECWKEIEHVFLDFATDNGDANIKAYVSDQTKNTFWRMKGYWSELGVM